LLIMICNFVFYQMLTLVWAVCILVMQRPDVILKL
jgi:hypothetical protein